MPDVYHYDEETGEVFTLFGSVPIDDTQASEDTVYSSAKVETMIEGVQEELNSKSSVLDGITASTEYQFLQGAYTAIAQHIGNNNGDTLIGKITWLSHFHYGFTAVRNQYNSITVLLYTISTIFTIYGNATTATSVYKYPGTQMTS